jgi:flagellar hook protein FlgE
MGIFDALNTAVSGMQAQSYALQNISGNIANSQTTAYKRTETNFEDLVPDTTPKQQIAGGVLASSVSTNNVQGDLQTSSIGTFMAINGDGYFVVEKPSTSTDGRPVFSGIDMYTRRGDFQPNKNGYLVNGAGYYLMGIPVDPKTGNLTGSVPQLLQFQNNFLPASPTTEIDYRANLASYPLTPSHDTNVSGSELLNPADFISNPIAGAPTAAKIIGKTANLSADAQASGTGTTGPFAGSATLASLGLANGNTITVADGTNTTTYTIANAATETVNNLIAGLSGGAAAVTASLVNGSIKVTSNNFLDTVTVGGSGAATAGFGSTNTTFTPSNLLRQGISQGQTLTVTVGNAAPQVITFGTSAGQVSTIAGLLSKLQALTGITNAAIDASGNISLAAANSTDSIAIGSAGASEVQANKFGITVPTALPANQTVSANDTTAFLAESVGGGAVTAYDTSGAPVNIQLRWAKVDSSTLGAGHTDGWNLFYQTSSNATGSQTAWQNAGANFTFGADGKMNPAITNLKLQNVTVNGTSLGNLSLVMGSGGVTQFADSNGVVKVNQLEQNGFAAGELQSVAVNDQGRIVGSYSNGRTIDLAAITLANFNSPNNLKKADGGAFGVTDESGPATYGASGKIAGASLEGSNTDIADEFSKLIVTQQAYSANTRIITTANQMVQDLLNIIR